MLFHYAWFLWSLSFLALWGVIFLFRKKLRKEMLLVSLWTMPLGLTEPLFVPQYWNPPSLFDLAQRTRFDIESLIFCFSIGGVGSVLYRLFFDVKETAVDLNYRKNSRHRFHSIMLILPIPIFIVLAVLTRLNHIYCGILAMFIGAIATLYCRPDLKYKIWVGGLLFTAYYALFFYSLIILVPNYVDKVWNLQALSGILVFKMPIEELLYAFTFGMLWSSVYEHFLWLTLANRRVN